MANDSKTLTDTDVADAAEMLGTDRATVLAVLRVEAAGSGFLDDGRPKVRFEAHHFSRLTGGRFDADHPDLSSPEWDPDLYAGDGDGEHARLRRAMGLDVTAALKAASWGMPQLMGFNHDLCGYDTVDAFVNDQRWSERRRLTAMVRYIKARGLDAPLRERDWPAFARGYNGPAYERHNYHGRLSRAYLNIAGESEKDRPVLRRGSRGAAVRVAQRALDAAVNGEADDPAPLAVDGIYGEETETVTIEFQTMAGLRVDGVVGPRTWAALDRRGLLDDTAAAAA